jgi:hypothetical protein
MTAELRLVEADLPIGAIDGEAASGKSARPGHISTGRNRNDCLAARRRIRRATEM